jgi:hypothetical protein
MEVVPSFCPEDRGARNEPEATDCVGGNISELLSTTEHLKEHNNKKYGIIYCFQLT